MLLVATSADRLATKIKGQYPANFEILAMIKFVVFL